MKQHINKLVIFVIISFFILQFGNRKTEAVEAKEAKDLITIASVLQGENIQIDSWLIYGREKFAAGTKQQDVENYAAILQKKFSKWEWTITENQQQWEAVGIAPNNKPHQEKITIVSTPTKQTTQAYIIYQVNGEAWDEKTTIFLKNKLAPTFSTIFRQNPKIFTCVKAETGDKMYTSLSSNMNSLLKAFKAKSIESLSENHFQSVSAASPLFAESLARNRDSMNLQIATRTQMLGGKTTLVVGTPIITIEY